MVLEDIDRIQKDALHHIEHHGAELLAGSVLQQFLLAVSAGSFITFAAALASVLSSEITSWGGQKFMQGLAFAGGFTTVILSGSALFTEINVVVPRFLLKHWRYTLRPTLSFWGVVWVGNLCGALFTATLLNLSGAFRGPPATELRTIMEYKMFGYLDAVSNGGTSGAFAKAWWQVVVSAVLGNWLVGMLAFFCAQARTVQGENAARIAFLLLIDQKSRESAWSFLPGSHLHSSGRPTLDGQYGDAVLWDAL